MSTTDCKRCGGEGMGQHSRARGMCYLCKRMPAGEGAAKVIAPADARARAIADIKAILGNVTRWHAEGELASWLDWTDTDSNPTVLENIRGLVGSAPADVAIRARAAFSRFGIAA